jgi:anti-sigma-K factor RskA
MIHQNTNNELEPLDELLALYALGGLEPDEQRLVEEYVAENPVAEAKLAEFQHTANWLPQAAVALPPSAEMSAQLFERVERNSAARFAAPPPATPAPIPARPPRPAPQITKYEPRPTWADVWQVFSKLGLMALVLVMGLRIYELNQQEWDYKISLASVTADRNRLERENGVLSAELTAVTTQNSALEQQLASLQTELASQQTIANLVSSPASYRIILPGTEANPEAQGQLLYDPEEEVAILVVADLPPLARGLVYQVLLIRDDGHDTAETFSVSTTGNEVLVIHSLAPLHTFTAVGVSIEPAGGSPQRTGEIILLGNLAN